MIIKIFEAGTYPQGRWDKERVQKLVDSYDPENGIEAPCVVGHNNWSDTQDKELAHGWVRSLSMNERGEVWADIEAFEELRGWVAARRLGYVSILVFADDQTDEKRPPRLGHVAFLGRTIPQIKTTRLPSMYSKDNADAGKAGEGEGLEDAASIYTRKIFLKKDFKDVGTFSKVFGDAGSDGGGDGDVPDGTDDEEFDVDKGKTPQERGAAELAAENERLRCQVAEFAREKSEAEVSGRLDELVKSGRIAPALREDFAKAALAVPESGREGFFAALEKAPVVADAKGHFATEGVSPQPMSNDEIRAFARDKGMDFEAAVDVLQREGRLSV